MFFGVFGPNGHHHFFFQVEICVHANSQLKRTHPRYIWVISKFGSFGVETCQSKNIRYSTISKTGAPHAPNAPASCRSGEMMSIYVEIVAYDGILGDDGPKNQNQRRVFGKSDLQSFAVRKMIVQNMSVGSRWAEPGEPAPPATHKEILHAKVPGEPGGAKTWARYTRL